MAPTPKVIKRSQLLISPQTQIEAEVTTFDRVQKSQLEYVLLWWLGHIAKPSNLHLGFKGKCAENSPGLQSDLLICWNSQETCWVISVNWKVFLQLFILIVAAAVLLLSHPHPHC